MPLRRYITSNDHVDQALEVRHTSDGGVSLIFHRDLALFSDGSAMAVSFVLDPDNDLPDLIRELRRVAKLAKQGGGNGAG